MDVLTSETCWALNNEIIKQVTSIDLSLINYEDDARTNRHNIYETAPNSSLTPHDPHPVSCQSLFRGCTQSVFIRTNLKSFIHLTFSNWSPSHQLPVPKLNSSFLIFYAGSLSALIFEPVKFFPLHKVFFFNSPKRFWRGEGGISFFFFRGVCLSQKCWLRFKSSEMLRCIDCLTTVSQKSSASIKTHYDSTDAQIYKS